MRLLQQESGRGQDAQGGAALPQARISDAIYDRFPSPAAPSIAQARSGHSRAHGLGLVGALVWYWQQAQSPGERAVSVPKALVWPAFLVYDALKALHR